MNLWKHQQDAIATAKPRQAWWWACGLGKTALAIELADRADKDTLVICPKSVKKNWLNEIAKYSHFPDNYTVATKEEFRRDYKKIKPCQSLILDECQFFANYKSQLFKSLKEYIKRYTPTNRWLLSATPWNGQPFSIWCYAEILGYCWNWFIFRAKYYSRIRMGRLMIWQPRKNIKDDVSRMLNSMGQTLRMDEVFDVPEQIFKTETVALNARQKQAITEIEEPLPLSRFTAINRIENEMKGEKLERIINYTINTPKIAIICRYTAQIELYEQELSKYCQNVFTLTGSTENRQELIDRVNALDECVIIIQSSVSAGYNLWSVPVMIFASLDYSFINYEQMKGRILRANNLKNNLYIHLITEGKSVDARVKKAIDNKQDFNKEIFE